MDLFVDPEMVVNSYKCRVINIYDLNLPRIFSARHLLARLICFSVGSFYLRLLSAHET
jgi:hypothetical protein